MIDIFNQGSLSMKTVIEYIDSYLFLTVIIILCVLCLVALDNLY